MCKKSVLFLDQAASFTPWPSISIIMPVACITPYDSFSCLWDAPPSPHRVFFFYLFKDFMHHCSRPFAHFIFPTRSFHFPFHITSLPSNALMLIFLIHPCTKFARTIMVVQLVSTRALTAFPSIKTSGFGVTADPVPG